jgi:hypothetical protein
MFMHPPTMDLGTVAPLAPHVNSYPRRASVSGDRNIASQDCERPKKKKGLARLWGLVTGHHKNSKQNAQQRRSEEKQVERPEDDAPLAPPPPLSYLVNRSPRERTTSSSSLRRTSVPSTPPSYSTLPTPTSIRNTWIEDGSKPMGLGMGGPLTAHTEESASNMNGPADPSSAPPMSASSVPVTEIPRGIQPMSSEPDMRQRMLQPAFSEVLQQQQQQFQQSMFRPSMSAATPRPISMYSLHKSLPPLPKEAMAAQSMPTPVDMPRPATMFDMSTQAVGESPEELEQPNPPFRHDVRRQSFSGTGSRTDLTIPSMGTFPLNRNNMQQEYGPAPAVNHDNYGYSPYAEMGEMGALPVPASRSANRLDVQNGLGNDKHLGKRRSRFGLSSLIGKVTGSNSRPSTSNGDIRVSVSSPTPGGGPPTSESDPSVTEYGVNGSSSRSRHGNGAPNSSGIGMGSGNGHSRMSVASRKAIEELVDQDPKFVAYRYPSVDQSIALLR